MEDISYVSLSDQILTVIENEILSGSIKPGERIVEMELAKKIGVSKSPVREALKKLESEGIVQLSPRRGYHVRRIDRKSVEDLFDVLSFFQPEAAARALPKKTEAICRELEQLLGGMSDAIARGDDRTYLRCNDQFHDVFYSLTGNEWLIKISALLHKHECLLRSVSLNVQERTLTSMAEHHAIFDAYRKGNQALLTRAIRQHLACCRECILRALALLEESGTGQ
jgi:DNA-binding GntR family transcriptional regulator